MESTTPTARLRRAVGVVDEIEMTDGLSVHCVDTTDVVAVHAAHKKDVLSADAERFHVRTHKTSLFYNGCCSRSMDDVPETWKSWFSHEMDRHAAIWAGNQGKRTQIMVRTFLDRFWIYFGVYFNSRSSRLGAS